jgi:elongation factor G
MKTIADQFVGKINIIKVLRGSIKAGLNLYNVTQDKGEKFGNITIMRGKNLENIAEVKAGDIFALSKLQYTGTGDSLCDAAAKLTFDPIAFNKPCISLAVTAKKQGEEEKVFGGLHRLEEEDPTISVTKNAETGDMLLNGMGEMHIEVTCQKLKNKFGVEAQLSEPKVAYRETIKKTAEAEGRHKKQSGGAGQFGVVSIRFEPIRDGSADFEFVNAIVGGVVPKEFIPAVEKGLRESIVHGVLAGYPMVNIRATLFDGKYHPVDSKEVAFKSAARLAYKAACAKAEPVILEPIGNVKVYIPDEYMGDIIGDMNRRRGRILGMNPYEGGQIVEAEVPMSEMVKYATDLRSMTQARGSFDIEFARYEEMPANLAQKVIDSAEKIEDEE